MSNPLSGGGGGNNNMMLPLMMMAMMPRAPDTPPSIQQPSGAPNQSSFGKQSFVSSAAPAPVPQNTAQKSLLGQ